MQGTVTLGILWPLDPDAGIRRLEVVAGIADFFGPVVFGLIVREGRLAGFLGFLLRRLGSGRSSCRSLRDF